MVQPPEPGTLVHSLAGRDAGEHYLVVGTMGHNTVLVANGLNRPLKSPKKKNLRHLRVHSVVSAEIAGKINRRNVRDEEIARAIRELVANGQLGGEREGTKPNVKEERRY